MTHQKEIQRLLVEVATKDQELATLRTYLASANDFSREFQEKVREVENELKDVYVQCMLLSF